MLTEDQWGPLLASTGFAGLDGAAQDYPQHPDQAGSVMFANAISSTTTSMTPKFQVAIIGQTVPGGCLQSDLESGLRRLGASTVSWLRFSDLVSFELKEKHCIILDDPEHQNLTQLDTKSFQGLQRLLRSSGILWVTGGTKSPDNGLVKGLSRTIRSEHPNVKLVTMSIDSWTAPRNDITELIGKIFKRSFYPSSQDDEYDTELVEKDGIVYIPRFAQDVSTNEGLDRETGQHPKEPQLFYQQHRRLKMTISHPGFLDTLCFVDDERAATPLPDDEIEIEIKASGLNFKDVILALGQLAGDHLGQECSGVINRVGRDVSSIKPGDRICSITESSIANLGRCKAACAVSIPDSMSYTEAASIPIIYCTAQYCLAHVARLAEDETVLIHAAAGGVGQAAIMLAQAMKAKILATVGSLEKKTFLMQTYNMSEDCIFYSRDTSFAQGIMEATGGRGVDVALNSLAGEQLRTTWECMAPFGRFVEIGKRDITSNMNLAMSPFERNVSFLAVDLTDVIHHRPQVVRQVLDEVMDHFKRKVGKPVSPIHEYSVSEVETVFRSLQSGKLMGKVVIVPKAGDVVMVCYSYVLYLDGSFIYGQCLHSQASRAAAEPDILHPDVSYLITGGTGGIGRSICRWMVQHGAKNSILVNRSGLPQPDTRKMIESLNSFEAKIEVRRCDVGDEGEVCRLVSDCAVIMPPIRGVVHGAFVSKVCPA